MSLINDPLHFLTVCYTNALCEGIDVKIVAVFCTEENHLLGCGNKQCMRYVQRFQRKLLLASSVS